MSSAESRPCEDFEREAARRARNLLPRAIIEGNDKHQAVIVLGQVFGFFKQSADIGGKVVAFADHAHAHIALVQFGKIVTDEPAQQRQQIANFRLRAATSFQN